MPSEDWGPVAPDPAPPPEAPGPSGAGTGEDAEARAQAPRAVVPPSRLHPLTLLFAVVQALKPWLLPALVVVVLRQGSSLSLIGAVLIAPILLIAIVRYATFTYRIDQSELSIRHGLLSRTERHVPLDRIQDLRLEQDLLQRWLGVGTLHVDTAGGEGADVTLAVISRQEAERLRALFALRPSRATAPASSAEPASARPSVVVRRLTFGELLLAGVTSTRLASVFVALAAVFSLFNQVMGDGAAERGAQRVGEAAAQVKGAGTTYLVAAIAIAVLLVLVLAVVLSTAAVVVLFHGFTLKSSGDELSRSYGLFTRRVITLPRRRIQVLEIEERILRRLAGLVTVRADTAGSARQGARAGGRDVLLPAIPRRELAGILPVFLPDLPAGDPAWRPVSRIAVRRGDRKAGVLLVLGAAAAAAADAGTSALVPLLLLPLAHLWNLRGWRSTVHATDGTYFWTRRGVLRRSTHVVPVRNIQAVELRQTPFDRRLGVATVIVDTAGQAFTGGGPRVRNVPLEEARELARRLAHGAVRTRYQWA